eukprot:TRINITY_DN11506_c0_g1_i1.p1 TRINITY_DN11506_c0_g1~~TRINITY_DN11506_c0_g1_i1.p1  ORF type:complete len:491 (-),score=85.01 TRINITY_DN11506_c0_g1_i1:6-1445(-)
MAKSAVWSEIKTMLFLSLPVVLTSICRIGMAVTDTIFLGHVGEKEMAAASIAESWAYSMLYLVLGVSFALDTLISQAYGAKNMELIGIVFQTSLFVGTLLSVPILILWLFTENIMILMQQDPEISKLAAQFIMYLLPSIFPIVYFRSSARLLQNQKIMIPGMVVSIIALIINAGLNYLFIFFFEMGFVGSPLSTTVSNYLQLLFLWVIILIKGYHKDSCDKFYKEAFYPKNIWKYLKLGIPSALMMWFEVFGFNGYTLLVGALKIEELTATQAIGFSCLSVSFTIPVGLAVGTSTRVGNLIGEKNAKAAKFASIVCGSTVFVWMIIQGGLISLFGRFLIHIWTDIPGVIETGTQVFYIVGIACALDGIQTLFSGLLRAVGRPNIGAIVNLIGHWIIGIPLGALFAFVLNMSIFGMWWSLCIALVLICVVYIVYILKLDWDEEVKRSEKLTGTENTDGLHLLESHTESVDSFLLSFTSDE